MIFLHKHFPFILTHRKIIFGLIIFLSSTAAGFIIVENGTRWYWTEFPYIALILILFSITFSFILFEAVSHRSSEAEKQIAQFNSIIHDLSRRQLEVFRLIVKGMTNKEICDLLFIEPSTLKSHINQIYKMLNMGNRKEAIRIGRAFLQDII